MIWIGVEDIILIHSKIIQKSGGIDGYAIVVVWNPQ